MKRLFAVSAVILSIAIVLNSCSGGGSSGTPYGGPGSFWSSPTTTISGTVTLSTTVAGSSKPSGYQVAPSGSLMNKVLTTAGIKQAPTLLPPLINATMKLYNADRPDWIYPVSQVFTNSTGLYTFNKMMNADLNLAPDGSREYNDGDAIPSGNYTVIATNDTTVSGGKQFVAVQAIIKRFAGDVTGNDLVVQDSEAYPEVIYIFGEERESIGGSDTILPTNAGIQIIFSMAMAKLSVIKAVTVTDNGGNLVAGHWKISPDLITATFYPDAPLNPDSNYSVKIAGGLTNPRAAVNVYGKPIPASIEKDFSTSSQADTTVPDPVRLSPLQQTNVPIITPIQIGFLEPIDINSIVVTGSPSIGDKPLVTFVGKKDELIAGQPVTYYVYEVGHSALRLGTNYTITVSGVKDMAGNQSTTGTTYHFTTESTSNGITVGGTMEQSQIEVKDVFGKWMNVLKSRNPILLTSYMSGDFFWLTNGWSPYDENRDGRLNLMEFRQMLLGMFADFEYCGVNVSGDITSGSTIDITGGLAAIEFGLNFTATNNLADQRCIAYDGATQTMYSELEYFNSAWLIKRGSDEPTTAYPGALEVIDLITPGNGTIFPEPTPTKPLTPSFGWTGIADVTAYALILMESGSNDTGWIAVVDGNTVTPGSTKTIAYENVSPTDGSYFVMPATNNPFGFTNLISQMKPGRKYIWSVVGFTAYTRADFEANNVPNLAADLKASSRPYNFLVINATPPYIISTTPDNGTLDVPVDLAAITATFSEAMNAASINTTTFKVNNGAVTGAVTYDDVTMTAIFTPSGVLNHSTTYMVSVTSGIEDAGNNSMAPDSWVFTTEAAPDTTAPTTTASPDQGTYNSAQNVSLIADEPATIYYTTDGSTPTTASTSYSGAIPITSTMTLKFFAQDTAGNSENVQTKVYTIDVSIPTTTASPAGGSYTTSTSVTLTADEAATIYYTTDGTSPTTASPVYTAAVPLGEGATTLKFFAKDTAGNQEAVKTENYTVDTQRPTVTINSQPTDPTAASIANFTFSSNEAGTTFQCQIDAGAFDVCTSPMSYNTTDGSHTFTVKAIDTLGNESLTPATYTWLRDGSGPTLSLFSIGSGNPAYTTSATVTLYSSADDAHPITGMRISNDGTFDTEPWEAYTAIRTLWSLTAGDGSKIVHIRVRDSLLNESATYSDDIMLDTTPPNTTITSGPANGSVTSSTSAIFTFTATEVGSTFECSTNGTAWSACTSPYTYPGAPLANGPHSFFVRAKDPRNWTDTTPATSDWVVDTNLLVTTASPVGGLYNAAQNVTLQVIGALPPVTTRYCLGAACDPTTGTLYTGGTISISSSATLRFYSVDNSETETVKQEVYTIDAAAPNTTITSGPTNPTQSMDTTFSFTASEPATFECQLDVGGYAACTSPISYTVAAGVHTFYVKATDTAGNTDLTPAAHPWTADNSGPTGSITINAGATYATSGSVTLSLSATDTLTSVTQMQISNDGTFDTEPMEGYTTSKPWTLTAGNGTKNVYARFFDAAGNVSSVYADSIVLDATAPGTIWRYPGVGTTGIPVTAILYFDFSEQMSAATINASTFTLTYASGSVTGLVTYNSTYYEAVFDPSVNLQYGTTYTATVTTGAKDLAGNSFAGTSWLFTTDFGKWDQAPWDSAKWSP